jgi:molecular chaperone HtpG
MKEGQKEIYHIFGPSRAAVELDPLLEIFKRKGIPVLYLFDPVDEFVISSLMKYKDFSFVSANSSETASVEKMDDVALDSNAVAPLNKTDKKHFDSLLEKIKNVLGDQVSQVKESKRMTESAVCLVNTEEGYSSVMHKLMRQANKEMAAPKKALLVNSDNKLIRNLLALFKKDSNDPYLNNMIHQLYEIAQLVDGDLSDPHVLAKRLLKYFEDSSDWFTKQSS